MKNPNRSCVGCRAIPSSSHVCARACGCVCVCVYVYLRAWNHVHVYMHATVLYSLVAACLRCTVVDNILGFIEDTCDCSRYYRCMRYESGWRALHMSCGQCLMWSQSDLTCSIRIPGCVASTTSTTTSGRFDLHTVHAGDHRAYSIFVKTRRLFPRLRESRARQF